MNKTSWTTTVVIAGLSILPACGGEDLGAMETQEALPAVENLAQTSGELTVTPWTYALPIRGGGGGSPTSTVCPGGYVAVGIYGRAGSVIDRLGLICRFLNADGSLGGEYYAGAQGGGGGNPFEIRCPVGSAVAGLYGGAGRRLDRLGLHCSAPTHWFSTGQYQSSTPVAGGGGGTAFNDACPGRYMVTSFNLRVGDNVDQVQGICSMLQ